MAGSIVCQYPTGKPISLLSNREVLDRKLALDMLRQPPGVRLMQCRRNWCAKRISEMDYEALLLLGLVPQIGCQWNPVWFVLRQLRVGRECDHLTVSTVTVTYFPCPTLIAFIG